MKRIYVGIFPPPYGGVTVKNELLFSEISKKMTLQKIDLQKAKKSKLLLVQYIIKIIFNRNTPFIVATSTKGRKMVTNILYFLNRKSLKQSSLIVMGGTFAKTEATQKFFHKKYILYKNIYVEIDEMKKELEKLGYNNVKIYPNCRKMDAFKQTKKTDGNNLKCIFFSLISKNKGADISLEAAKYLKNVTFDFYGEIDETYKEEFLKVVSQNENINYKGVFVSGEVKAHQLLHNYDIMLFPTKWKNEGVPGTLVEAKFAGLPSIVSDEGFNSILVKDKLEGVVLEENDSGHLKNAIEFLMKNERVLDQMKEGALKSSSYFDINNYIEILCEQI